MRLALRGHDVPARASPRRSVAHGRVLGGPDRCWRAARQIVRWLAVCALHRCTEGGQSPRAVRIEIVTAAGAAHAAVARLTSPYEFALLRALTARWDAAGARDPTDPPARVGVVLESLCDSDGASLFEPDRASGACTG